MTNAKNRLQELLQKHGHSPKLCTYIATGFGDPWEVEATLLLPGHPPIVGRGSAAKVVNAEIAAAEHILAQYGTVRLTELMQG